MSRRYSLADMHALASSQGGKFLSARFTTLDQKYKWECHNGHIRTVTAASVLSGAECRECFLLSVRKTITDAQNAAAKRGGVCLAKKLLGSGTPVEWRCDKGHLWKAAYRSVNAGHWCPTCRHRTLSIEDLRKVAASRGGECLSSTYTRNREKYRWRCREGHIWEAPASRVKFGSWCPACAGQIITLTDTQRFAAAKGGKCLSRRYLNAKTRMQWRCKEKHTWWQTWERIHAGHWCRRCAKRFSIEEVKAFAGKEGGKFLSSRYESARIRYLWQCASGHRWMAAFDHVKNRGRWCPECRRLSNRRRSAMTKQHTLKLRT